MLKRSMFTSTVLYPMLLLCALIVLPVPAFAIATLSISSPGADGVFVVQGAGMQGVEGMHLVISYDSATLTNPRFTSGPLVRGMVSVPNLSNPIQLAIVGSNAIGSNGSGIIGTLTFDRTGASPGSITSFTVRDLIAASGTKVAYAQPVVINPAVNQQPGDGSATTTSTTTAPLSPSTTQTTQPASQPYVLGGTVTLPPMGTGGDEKKEPAAQPAQIENAERPVEAREAVAPTPEAGEAQVQTPKGAAQPAPVPQQIQSVLERFRLFTGEKTVKNLTALFNRDSAASFSQSPAIGISDGAGSVKLTVTNVAGERAPNFAFNSARYVSLTRIGDGEWEIEVVPEKGAVKASVTMLSDETMQEFPLTVSPKAEVVLNKSGQLTEADFALFLKDRGTEAAPKFDLNGDGRRDYVDDYIFSANYLVKLEDKAKKSKAAK